MPIQHTRAPGIRTMRLSKVTRFLGVWFVLFLIACTAKPIATPPPTETAIIQPPSTSTATAKSPNIQSTATCADVDANWGKDWSAALEALEQLIIAEQTCGEEPLESKKYAAHFNYAATLENTGQIEDAIVQYQAAFLLNSERKEALGALVRLEALPKPTPATCLSTSPPNPDPAPEESPDVAQFAVIREGQLIIDEEVFAIRGVNYYPRHTPWHRFIKEFDAAEVATELNLIQEAGFNTLRVFLWYDALFTCQPEDAIPNEIAFANVDTLLRLASERNLKLIVTLNDLPDLTFRPLYTDWSRYDNQTIYIVRRYRNDPNILAWDLRNEGDLDYGARSGEEARFSQETVLTWLAHTSQLVRANDPDHLLTAGWWGDPTVTGPYVDFLSFHHWYDAQQLQTRLETYQEKSQQPLLLQEVGYHSWQNAPTGARDELTQAAVFGDVLGVAQEQNLLGWVIWTAFDFIPQPGQPTTYEHFFGLWRSDLTPKPALDVLP